MNEEIMNKLSELAVKFGQPTIDAGLFAAKVAAATSIVQGGLLAAFGLFLIYMMYRVTPRSLFYDRHGDFVAGPEVMFLFLPAFAFGMMVVIGLGELGDVKNWVSIWHPEVYLASKILF